MVKISKRIEELRTEKGVSRFALCQELGFPKMTIDKFEAGKLTPTKAQQEKLAEYFGVTVGYLCGEDDSMSRWISEAEKEERQAQRPVRTKTVKQQSETQSNSGSMMDAFTKSDLFTKAVLEVLKSEEGQALIRKAMGKK